MFDEIDLAVNTVTMCTYISQHSVSIVRDYVPSDELLSGNYSSVWGGGGGGGCTHARALAIYTERAATVKRVEFISRVMLIL